MKRCRLMIAVAAAALMLPVHPSTAGVGDPVIPLYFFPGVYDSGGGSHVGVATVVHCTNFSGATEKIEYVVLTFSGALKADKSFNINNGETRTASTHDTLLYSEDFLLATGGVSQGVVGVYATSTVIFCTAQVLDASVAVPNGIDLHGVRLNPIAGTTE